MAKLFVFDPPYLQRKSQGVDYWGIGMLALGMGSLQIMLDKGQQEDWFSSNMIAALAVIAAVMLLSFIIYEFYARSPVIDLHVFRDRTYAIGVFMITALGFVLYGSLVLLPIILQTLLGYPSLQAGIAMAPRGLGSLIFMPVIGIVLGRIGARKLLGAGILLCSATLFWFGYLDLDAGYWDFFWPQIAQGISMSLLFVPMTTIAMDAIPREGMGNATSLYNLMRNIGGSFGIATAATMMERSGQKYTNILVSDITPFGLRSQQLLDQMSTAAMAGGSDAVTAAQRAEAMAFGMVQRQATMLSYINLMRLFGILFILCIPLVPFARPPRAGTSKPAEAGH